MAEAPKPARKTTKRGPTKAAALKALGLTQKDLDALKALSTAGLPTPPDKNVVEASAHLTPGPGFGGREDPLAVLETRPAPPPQEVAIPQAPQEMTWYMRNLRNVEVGFRLSRQSESGQKRTQLKPRGQRGDIVRLETEDLKDGELQTQVAFGLVEVIPEGEALAAIKKQSTNQRTAIPVHIAALRNEKGEELSQVRTLTDEEAMGYKVADLDPAVMQGKLSDREIARNSGFAQQNIVGPVQTPSPGRIVSDGFMAAEQQALGGAGDNERAAQIDALARSKQYEGPGAGLGEVTVKVAPVQREG
jgi:hypothetical protein